MREELERRLQFLVKAKDNPTLQALEMDICKRDILYFFRNHLYTDKNQNLFTSDEPNKIPLIPFPFQEELITEIRDSIIAGTRPISERDGLTNVFIEKSRQMGVSWIVVGIFIYGFLFHNHKYHIISQKQDDVDKAGDMRSLFEKARFYLRNLPQWMLPIGFSKDTGTDCNKSLAISRKDGGSITGESANPNASRGGTYNAVFMDEMAFMDNASTINTSAAAATPCRIFNSTPNGEGNEFYRMRKLTMKRKGDEGQRVAPEIKGLRYHWSEHPLYDKMWYDWKIKGMTREKIAQELEISYNIALEGRVYKDFTGETDDVDYDPTKPLYMWIDNSHGGSDPHAIVVAQTDPKNHYIDIIDCIQINCSIPDICSYLATTPKMNLNTSDLLFLNRYQNYNWKRATFIGDPYDTKTEVRDIHNPQGIVIADEYRKVGIHMNTPQRIGVKTRIMNTQANIYRIRVHERCADFISAIQNARYPEVNENSNRTTAVDKPRHDWTSHYRTAMEYGIAWILENENKPKTPTYDMRPTRNMITGELVYRK